MSVFDTIPIREKVERDKHLRVERLVKLQTRDCKVCGDPVVWAGVGPSGKRLPFNPSALLGNSIKVVIGTDESLDVWAIKPMPRKHFCNADKIQAKEERDAKHYHPVARVETDGEGHFSGVTECCCDTGQPDWPGHSFPCLLAVN